MKKLVVLLSLSFILVGCGNDKENLDINSIHKKQIIEVQSIEKLPESNNKVNLEIGETDNDIINEKWKIYKNEKFNIEFLYPEEYPVGNKISLRQDGSRHLRIQNFICLEDNSKKCIKNIDEKDYFFIEINNSSIDTDINRGKYFGEYLGIIKYGNNEFYNGINYGPSSPHVYILKNNTKVSVSFHGNIKKEFIPEILKSIKIKK